MFVKTCTMKKAFLKANKSSQLSSQNKVRFQHKNQTLFILTWSVFLKKLYSISTFSL